MNRPYMPGARSTRSEASSMRRIVAAFVAFLIAVTSFSTLMTRPASAEDDPANGVADLVLSHFDINGKVDPDEAVVAPGGTFNWTIEIRNDGPDVALATRSWGPLIDINGTPNSVTIDSWSASTGTISVDVSGNLDWQIGDMTPGQVVTAWVSGVGVSEAWRNASAVYVDSDTIDEHEADNNGDAYYTVNPWAPVVDADIAITKTVDDTAPAESDLITYTVEAYNAGPADATGLTVRDDFPTDIIYLSDDSGGSYDPATGIWTIGSLASGARVTLQISGTVAPGTAGSTIKNVASVATADEPDPDSGNNSAVATITVRDNNADLGITKTVDNANPREGDTITYALTITNGGPAEATGIAVNDQLPAGVTYVSDDSGGDYEPATGNWFPGTLASGDVAVLHLIATVDTGTSGTTITNTATVAGADQPDSNPDNDSSSVGITVVGADLEVTKTVDDANPAVGDTIVYQMRVTNGGPDDTTGVEITDVLPTGITYVSDDAGGDYDPATGVWTVGDLAAGASVAFDITATVDAGTAGTTITNTAAVTASDEIDPNPDNDSNDASITVAGADLSIQKTVDNRKPSEGESIIYTVIVTNHGPDDATGVVVTDQLPADVTYQSDDSGGTYNESTGVWDVGGLGNGAQAELNITARVNNGTTGATIANTATITASNPDDPNPGNNTDAIDVTVVGADLSVAKTVNNANPAERDLIVYTVRVTNSGPDDATGVEITDQLPAGVTYVTHNPANSYDPVTGVWNIGDLANGQTATLLISATVDVNTAGDTIVNTAEVTAVDQHDPNPSNDSDSAPITVAGADLGIQKTVDNGTPGEGETIIYTLILVNRGPDDATGVQVTDQLPTGVTYVSHDASVGTYVEGTGIWDVGNLANGNIATLRITVTVDPGTTGQTIYNDAAITARDQDDPNLDNNSAFAQIVVTGADLGVVKTVDAPNPAEGDEVVFQVRVTNGGPDEATGLIVIDQLPAGVTYVSGTATQGSYNDATGAWDVGTLGNGDSATLRITAAVDTGTTGTVIVNTATASADQVDPNPTNDGDSADIRVSGTDLGVTKTVDDPQPTEGQTIHYTVILSNHGPDDATGIVVTDVLPTADLTYVSSTATHGSYDGGTGLWTVGSLDHGDIAVLEITATVNVGASGTIVNTATITAADQHDPNPDNDSDSAGIEITGADLNVTKTVDDPNPIEGANIVYTVTVTNGGPEDATGVEITDRLPAGVTYVSNDAGNNYDPGTGIWAVGALANGASDTIHITATVDAGTTGLTIVNDAAVNAVDQTDPNADNDTDTAIIEIAGTDLGVVKTVDDTEPQPGDTIRYTVILSNHGPDDATGVVVTDQLPGDVTYMSSNATAGSYNGATGIWDVGNFGNGQIEVLAIIATVNSGTAGHPIVNTATITALDQNDPNPDNDSDDAGIEVTGADLSVTKTVDDPSPIEGGAVVYTVHVTNGGPRDATNVEVTDQLPAGVTYLQDDSAGSYDETTGVWSIPAVANGDTVTLRITAIIDAGTTGTTITNTATVTAADQEDSDPTNNTDSAGFRVAGTDLGVMKTVDNNRPIEGDTLTYSVIISNHGPDDATNVAITDQLPAGLTFVSSTPSVGTYDETTGIWMIGDLGNGEIETLFIEATVDKGTTGDRIVNTATITAVDQNDPNPDNDSDEAGIEVTGADLGVIKTVDNANPAEGDTIIYTIHVINGGPDAATGVEVTDQLPAGVTYVSDDANGDYNSTTGAWTVGNLGLANTATLRITAVVDTGTAATIITNTATVTALDQHDPNPDDDTDSADIAVVGADLVLAKTVHGRVPNEGETILYRVIVGNRGPDAATGVEVTDRLPKGVTYVSDDSVGKTYDPVSGVWTVGGVDSGKIIVLQITATVDTGTSGDVITNHAEITAANEADPDPDNNFDDASIIVGGADIGVTKAVDEPNPHEGATIVYTIHVTNGGPQHATGIEITDQLPAGVTYVSDSSGGAYDPATGVWMIPSNGNGETATLKITATVDAGTAGTTITNKASVTALDQDDPNPDNDSDDAVLTVRDSEADLGVTKTVDNTNPAERDTVVYTIVVTNGGPNDATSVEITETIPAGVTYVSDDSGGSYDPATGRWTIGDLANGATATLKITATVDDGTVGQMITNTSAVTGSDQNDPNPDNNASSAEFTVGPRANRPPNPVVPDGDGNLVPVDHVTDSIPIYGTPAPLDIVDPDGDAFTVKILTGYLPTGITMDENGVFHGTAQTSGRYVLTMETCDDVNPAACSTFTYTLTVGSLPVTGIDAARLGVVGLFALIFGMLVLVGTRKRRRTGATTGR